MTAEAINWARYGIADQMGSAWSMDARHADWIKATLERIRVPIAVEVGCHLGVSTLAILESGVPEVHLVDLQITDSVRQMATDYGATIYEEPSDTALPKMPPLSEAAVLLDGDHSYPVVKRELELLYENLPRLLICHDVTARLIGLDCEGCMWLWHAVQAAGWLCYVDCLPRNDERTERGLLIATRSVSDHLAVVEAYAEVYR